MSQKFQKNTSVSRHTQELKTKQNKPLNALPNTISNPLSVSEIHAQLRGCIEHHFQRMTLRGEVNNWTSKGTYAFLSLKDQHATIEAVIWSSSKKYIDFEPEEGDEVIVFGRVSTKKKHSACQFIIERMIPSGKGEMQREFNRLYKSLKGQGLFNRRRRLPLLPNAIGLVTSETSSAYHDFMKIARQRAPGIPICFESAVMQGEQTVDSVIRALTRVSGHPNVEVIALTRGGGAMEDLWVFNDERLARFLVQSPVPIVVGIGHEDDTLIAELVADHRGPNPTGVADIIFPHISELKSNVSNQLSGLNFALEKQLQQRLSRLSQLTELLRVPHKFEGPRLRLEQTLSDVDTAINHRFKTSLHRLTALTTQLHQRAPHVKLSQAMSRHRGLSTALSLYDPITPRRLALEHMERSLDQALEALIERHSSRWHALCAELHGLSPLAILSRGYSITTRDKQLISDAEEVAPNDTLEIQLGRGQVVASVLNITPGPPSDERPSLDPPDRS
jgi:exodeoxyribonuclease VII large subunit